MFTSIQISDVRMDRNLQIYSHHDAWHNILIFLRYFYFLDTTTTTAGPAGHEVHYNIFLYNGFWFPTLKIFYSPHDFSDASSGGW